MTTTAKLIKDKIDWRFIQHLETCFTKYEDESEHDFRDIYVNVLPTDKLEKCPNINDNSSFSIYSKKRDIFVKVNNNDKLLMQIDKFGISYIFHYDILGFNVDRNEVNNFIKRVLHSKYRDKKFATSMDGIDRYIWFI